MVQHRRIRGHALDAATSHAGGLIMFGIDFKKAKKIQESMCVCPECGELYPTPIGPYYGDPTRCLDCQSGGGSWSGEDS